MSDWIDEVLISATIGGWKDMNPFDVVTEFENTVSDYCGSNYAVAVDSCTNALLLCLTRYRMEHGVTRILLPHYTYVGVAQAVLMSGNTCGFVDYEWSGKYQLVPTNIGDSARRFYRGMYTGGEVCLSFHWQKLLPIGKGGMILLDDKDRADLYRKMRYDGRTAGVLPADDVFVPGYHCFMDPKDAIQGLSLMQYVKDYYDDLPADGYGDLSKQPIFILL